jgi:radical SAM protein with 4Fe4S-binding SPASM domain
MTPGEETTTMTGQHQQAEKDTRAAGSEFTRPSGLSPVLKRNAIPYLPEHILFQWHITDRCNLRCSHCYQEDIACPEPSWADLMEVLEQFRSFILNSRRRAGKRQFRAHVTVTGGEPFMRDDFMALLEKLAEENRLFSIAILTNGTTLTPSVVRSLRRLNPGFVQVSIDGRPETHDHIRGQGSYELAVKGLRLLSDRQIPTHISFTAHRLNFRDFPHVARLGHRLGVTRVWADRLVPCGRGSASAASLLTPDETREFFGMMRAESRRGWLKPRPVALLRSLQFTVTGDRPYRCSAGDTLLTVLPNGNVCPCRRMPLVVGNIFNEDLGQIYAESRLLHELRDRQRISRGCEKCFYARTCGGGSRCIAFAVHGDPNHADPGCWLAVRDEAGSTPSSGDFHYADCVPE